MNMQPPSMRAGTPFLNRVMLERFGPPLRPCDRRAVVLLGDPIAGARYLAARYPWPRCIARLAARWIVKGCDNADVIRWWRNRDRGVFWRSNAIVYPLGLMDGWLDALDRADRQEAVDASWEAARAWLCDD